MERLRHIVRKAVDAIDRYDSIHIETDPIKVKAFPAHTATCTMSGQIRTYQMCDLDLYGSGFDLRLEPRPINKRLLRCTECRGEQITTSK